MKLLLLFFRLVLHKKLRSIPTFLTELWRHHFLGYDVISDVFQKIQFRRTDFRKHWHDCSFWRYKVTEKKSDRFRYFWRRYVVIKIVGNDVIGKKWWRHNNVKNVRIVLNFFCELVLSKWTIVPIFTKIGSAEVYFLKKVGYDVIPQKMMTS